MTERDETLSLYQHWMSERWKTGRLTLDDVHTLKLLCEIYCITPEEHEVIAARVGVEPRQLMDEENQSLSDYLRWRRRPLPPGSGALRFALPASPLPWRTSLKTSSTTQDYLAILCGIILAAALCLALLGV